MKNKNTIKVNDNQYIKLEKDNRVFLISTYEKIFSKDCTEYRTELVPKQTIDLEGLNKTVTEILEKLSKNDFIVDSKNLSFCVSKIDNLENQIVNIKDTIKEEIYKDRKYQENKDLIESDMFKSLKEIEKFKDMNDLELLDLVKKIDEVFSKYGYKGGKH